MKKIITLFLLLIVFSSFVFAQSTTPEEYTYDEFSPVLHTIRRTEIVTLGSLPFTVLLSNLGYQIIRIAFINPDAGFVNPLAKSSSSSNTFTEKEQIGILAGGLSLSLCVGLTDTIISIIKNSKTKKTETYDSSSNIHIDTNKRVLPEIKIENPYLPSESLIEEQNDYIEDFQTENKEITNDEGIN